MFALLIAIFGQNNLTLRVETGELSPHWYTNSLKASHDINKKATTTALLTITNTLAGARTALIRE
jgi:hypothetical protein